MLGLIPAHAGKTSWARPVWSSGTAHPRSRGENSAASFSQSQPPWLIPAHEGKTPQRPSGKPPSAAHPRSRGENSGRYNATGGGVGSSPLTRGKHDEVNRACGGARLIPAHAGKTEWKHMTCGLSVAHPRSRGENARLILRVLEGSGSSPLTRGNPSVSTCPAACPWLIPAHAGITRG